MLAASDPQVSFDAVLSRQLYSRMLLSIDARNTSSVSRVGAQPPIVSSRSASVPMSTPAPAPPVPRDASAGSSEREKEMEEEGTAPPPPPPLPSAPERRSSTRTAAVPYTLAVCVTVVWSLGTVPLCVHSLSPARVVDVFTARQ